VKFVTLLNTTPQCEPSKSVTVLCICRTC